MNYKHTQIGDLIIFATLIVVLYLGFILTKVGLDYIIIAILTICEPAIS